MPKSMDLTLILDFCTVDLMVVTVDLPNIERLIVASAYLTGDGGQYPPKESKRLAKPLFPD